MNGVDSRAEGRERISIKSPAGERTKRPRSLRVPAALRLPTIADQDGQSMVEFALVAPMVLILATGICFMGICLQRYLVLTNAVTTGAQQVAISRGSTTDPCATAASAVSAAVPGLSSSSLTFTLTLSSTAYGPYTGVSNASCSKATLSQNESATLTVSYPVTIPIYGFKNQNFTMTATTEEIVQ